MIASPIDFASTTCMPEANANTIPKMAIACIEFDDGSSLEKCQIEDTQQQLKNKMQWC